MKRLIVILALLLVLAGGGAAAGWWFYLREEPVQEVVQEEYERPEERVFWDMDPLIVPVIRDGQVIEHLTFTIIIELSTLEGKREAYYATLRLTDAFRTELHALYSHRIMQNREDAIPIVSKRLTAIARRIVGPEAVDKVLVSILSQRELG